MVVTCHTSISILCIHKLSTTTDVVMAVTCHTSISILFLHKLSTSQML